MSNEQLWAGEFGDAYTDRNETFNYADRFKFFKPLILDNKIESVLEVGCNTGMNLGMLKELVPSWDVWGCDVNIRNVQYTRERWPDVQSVYASGFDLPFRDDYFDLVFTSGVLIHQKPSEVERIMQEIIRVSSKYVMAIEYYSEQFEEIETYSGGPGTAFKGPYGEIYQGRYGLKLLKTQDLRRDQGWDRCACWLLEK
jgi:pseudaminic acid biosynthesis-associated methylase